MEVQNCFASNRLLSHFVFRYTQTLHLHYVGSVLPGKLSGGFAPNFPLKKLLSSATSAAEPRTFCVKTLEMDQLSSSGWRHGMQLKLRVKLVQESTCFN